MTNLEQISNVKKTIRDHEIHKRLYFMVNFIDTMCAIMLLTVNCKTLK